MYAIRVRILAQGLSRIITCSSTAAIWGGTSKPLSQSQTQPVRERCDECVLLGVS